MEDFLPIPDSRVILRQNGIYRSAQLFENNKNLFAKHGGGFIKLLRGGSSTHKSILWSDAFIKTGQIQDTGVFLTWLPIMIPSFPDTP